MRHYLKIIISLLFVCICQARDVQETFLRANHLYKSKNYQNAFDLYNSIERKGNATWHNMGNCAFKLNKHVDALVCWRKAQRGSTASEIGVLNSNIAVANEILGNDQKLGFFNSLSMFFLNRFSFFILQFLFLLFWFVLFGVGWMLKSYRWVAFIVLVPLNFLFGGAVYKKYRMNKYPFALVTKSSTSVFAGPDQRYNVVGKVDLVRQVTVIKQIDKWYKVSGERLVGWVLADTIEIV